MIFFLPSKFISRTLCNKTWQVVRINIVIIFFLLIFFRDYLAPRRRSLRFSECSLGIGESAFEPAFRKSQIRREDISLGRSTRYATFASSAAGESTPDGCSFDAWNRSLITRCPGNRPGCPSNFTRQETVGALLGGSSTRCSRLITKNSFRYFFSNVPPRRSRTPCMSRTAPARNGQRRLLGHSRRTRATWRTRESESHVADLCRAYAGRKSHRMRPQRSRLARGWGSPLQVAPLLDGDSIRVDWLANNTKSNNNSPRARIRVDRGGRPSSFRLPTPWIADTWRISPRSPPFFLTNPPSSSRYKRSSRRADNKRRRTHAHNNNNKNTRIEAALFLSLARHPIEFNATGRLTTTKV